MTSLLRKYILGDEKVESIIKDKFEVGIRVLKTLFTINLNHILTGL